LMDFHRIVHQARPARQWVCAPANETQHASVLP
jgi:hypothetical protein